MAYGEKYWGIFKDYYDRDIRISIQERNYSGSIEEMKLIGAGVEYNGDENNIYKPIMSSGLNISVLSETNFQYIDLYSADAKKYKVEVTLDGALDWIGFIIPDLFNEPYDAPPYESKIVASDGLQGLKSIQFGLEGVKNEYQIVEYCIGQIYPDSVQTFFYESLNTYEENQDRTTSDSPLDQTYIDCERYIDNNCLEVLQSILDLYGARIYMKDGIFWIVSIHEFKNELNWRKFGITKTNGTYNPELLIGRPVGNNFANIDQQLDILPAWKEFTINIDLRKKESFIKNWDFTEWTKGVQISPRNYEYDPNYWPGTATVRRSVGEKQFMYFTDNNTESTSNSGELITNLHRTQDCGSSWVESDRSIIFNLEFAILRDKIAPQDEGMFWIKIEMWDGGSNYYYMNDEGEWKTNETYIIIEEIKQRNNWTFEKVSLISDGIPTDGSLYVYIYASDSGNLGINKFKGQLLTEDKQQYPDDFEYLKQINQNNNYIPGNIDLMVADFPDYNNQDTKNPTSDVGIEQFVYFGGTFLESDKSEVTTQWQTRDEIVDTSFTDADQLHKIISTQKEFLKLPQWAITGTILSQNINPDSCIIDYQISNRKYLLSKGIFDLRTSQCNGTYIEIGSYSGADWILDDGTWNDDGIWKDGETWNDS